MITMESKMDYLSPRDSKQEIMQYFEQAHAAMTSLLSLGSVKQTSFTIRHDDILVMLKIALTAIRKVEDKFIEMPARKG